MPIYPNIYQTLLPGPIVELRGYLAACGLRGRLYAYLNYNGPTGTARDELAEGMLALALERGALTPGQTIVEAVSGPFATALTLAGLTAGHPVTLVMPEDGRRACSASERRSSTPRPRRALQAHGRWQKPPPPKRAGTIWTGSTTTTTPPITAG